MDRYNGDEQIDVMDDGDVVRRVSDPASRFGPLGDIRLADTLPLSPLARPASFPRFNTTGVGGPGGVTGEFADSQCGGAHGVITPGAYFDPLQDQESIDLMARIRRPIPGPWDEGTAL